MVEQNLLEHVRPWIKASLGYELPGSPTRFPKLDVTPDHEDSQPFFAVRVDQTVAVAARNEWLDELRPILADLHPDLLFSVAGTYELSRVTLPDGVAVWGPVPCYVADESTWRPVDDARSVKLSEPQLAEVDFEMFWHAAGPEGLAHFGVYEDGRLMALASASDKGHSIYEIGVEARQGAQGRGLGTAVVSAAGDWILEQGAVPFASAATWNVPSGRNLRRLGMRYVYSALISWEGPFQVPPQPLGQPMRGQPVFNRYPAWAMNKDIREKPSL
ncbi:MAG: GNAT family N-acetyltransferase [Dehalococcoidia bacterium]|nr:GNAT family N-acetyltransferase [Dehalococcoidia bacterium]